MPETVKKICVLCGKDVAGIKRIKDPEGRYYCEPCHAPLRERAAKLAEKPASSNAIPKTSATAKADDYGELDLAPVAEPVKPKPLVPIKALTKTDLGGGPPLPVLR